MLKSKFFRFLTCSFIIVGNFCLFIHSADANPPQIKPTHSAKLRPMPEGYYQLARLVFLPNADDDIWLPSGNFNKSPCKDMGYPLTVCPTHGNCSTCPLDSGYYKLDTCNNDGTQKYKVSADRTYCQKVCDAKTCDTSIFFMLSCPDAMDCDKCVEIRSDCSQIVHLKPTTRCISGYHYDNGRCVKDCSVVSCGPSQGPTRTWKEGEKIPEGYLTKKISTTFQTKECKTGACYQFTGCDQANGYFRPSGSSGGDCEYFACYDQVNSCSGYTLDSCPDYGVCNNTCTVKNKDCSEGDTKVKLTGCIAGYHLNEAKTACEKDCVIGTQDINKTEVILPQFDTIDECKAMEGVKFCAAEWNVYIDKNCNTKTKYVPTICQQPEYQRTSTSETKNGIKYTTRGCKKSCTQNSCSNFSYTWPDYCPTYSTNDRCPKGYICSTCQVVNADCSTGKTLYKPVKCDAYYENAGYDGDICCIPKSCKNFLIERDPSIHPDLLVENVEDFKKAIEGIGQVTSGYYEETIILTEPIYLPEDFGSLPQSIKIKGAERNDFCQPITLKKDIPLYFSSDAQIENIIFDFTTPQNILYGGGTYRNCTFTGHDHISTGSHYSVPNVALIEDTTFENCEFNDTAITLDGNNGSLPAKKYVFNNATMNEGTIIPIDGKITISGNITFNELFAHPFGAEQELWYSRYDTETQNLLKWKPNNSLTLNLDAVITQNATATSFFSYMYPCYKSGSYTNCYSATININQPITKTCSSMLFSYYSETPSSYVPVTTYNVNNKVTITTSGVSSSFCYKEIPTNAPKMTINNRENIIFK